MDQDQEIGGGDGQEVGGGAHQDTDGAGAGQEVGADPKIEEHRLGVLVGTGRIIDHRVTAREDSHPQAAL